MSGDVSKTFALGALLAACGGILPAVAQAQDASVHRDGGVLVYHGPIDAAANARAGELLDEGGVRRLRITSPGGEVGLGMDLGELVRRRGLDVEVAGVCASSCANYVFPAGARKLLAADAAVIWHGSAIQEDVGAAAMIDFDAVARLRGRPLDEAEKAAMIGQFAAYGRAMRERQAGYYAALGLDARITVFGQDVGCDCDWTIPVQDMARFGLRDVEAPQGYGAALSSLHKPVAMLRLDDHPDYAAAVDAARLRDE